MSIQGGQFVLAIWVICRLALTQGVRRCGLRRSRYIGEPRTHLQYIATAVAMNLLGLHDWVTERPTAKTRLPPFAALIHGAA